MKTLPLVTAGGRAIAGTSEKPAREEEAIMTKAEIIQDTLKAIDHLRQSKPGHGDIQTRRFHRQQAEAILPAYFAVKTWPKRFQAIDAQISQELCDLL